MAENYLSGLTWKPMPSSFDLLEAGVLDDEKPKIELLEMGETTRGQRCELKKVCKILFIASEDTINKMYSLSKNQCGFPSLIYMYHQMVKPY